MFFTSPTWAAIYTAAGNSQWGNASAWSPAGVPGAGDTVNIPDGITITLNQNVTIGNSSQGGLGPHRGPHSSIAISLNNSGQLVLAQGALLILRGDIVYNAANCTNTSNAVVMQAGSTLEFDSSAAPSPARTHYSFGPTGNGGCRGFISAGTAGQRNTVFSNSGGGAGMFSIRGNVGANGPFVFTYTDFMNIGDASNPGWQIAYEYSGNNLIQWNVTNSTFTNCGPIASVDGAALGIDSGGVFRHSYNVHNFSQGSEIFNRWINIRGMTGGVREIRNNVFDIPMSVSEFYPLNFTILSNYFAQQTALGPGAWTSFSDNFYRMSSSSFSLIGLGIGATGDIYDSYLFYDSDGTNPHVVFDNTGAKLYGIVFGQGGNALGGPVCSACDSGELFWLSNPTVPSTEGIYRSIILPNMSGYGSLELGSLLVVNQNVAAVAEHNTYFGGFGATTAANQNSGFGAIQMAESAGWFPSRHYNVNDTIIDPSNHLQHAIGAGNSGNSFPFWNDAGGTTVDGSVTWQDQGATARVQSFRSNILWNPQLAVDSTGSPYNYQSSFFKVEDVSLSTNPAIDICSPGACDYNTGLGFTATDSAQGQYTNQQKGYAAKFSSAPGIHDVDTDPRFADYQRAMELFDSKYLGNNPAGWNAGATYNVGDFVQWRRQDVYWAVPVNYRYQNTGACSGANPEPGNGANWRDCWEWATLYRVRTAIAAGVTFNDFSIGASGDDIILTIIKWIRAGYKPTNFQLSGAAHDGTDIGAVPLSFPTPATVYFGDTINGGPVH